MKRRGGTRSHRRAGRQSVRLAWPCGQTVKLRSRSTGSGGNKLRRPTSRNTARRWDVWMDQQQECTYCGVGLAWYQKSSNPPWNIHHVIPKSNGGTDRRDNLRAICVGCHTALHRAESDERGVFHILANALGAPNSSTGQESQG